MLSLFDWGNTKLPRSENKTGLPFAWVKISVLKKLRGIYFSAMRVARGCGSGYIRYLRNERLRGKENSKISFFFNIGKAQIKKFSSSKRKFCGVRSSNKKIAFE